MADPTYDAALDRIVIPNDPGANSTFRFKMRAHIPAQQQVPSNWAQRIADPGVVWYHGFQSAAEVNNFRWTAGYGNDPNAIGTPQAGNTKWVSSGGPDGMGYLEILRPGPDTGGTGADEATDWWRPFGPIVGTANGKGVDDPACQGAYKIRPDGSSMTPQAWNPNNIVEIGTNFAFGGWSTRSRPAWYGHSSYATNSHFDGTDFYIQMRVMTDPRSSQDANDGSYNSLTGKYAIICSTITSSISQSQVAVSRLVAQNNRGVGAPNYHSGYTHQANGQFPPWGEASLTPAGAPYQVQAGSELISLGTCFPQRTGSVTTNGCWAYALDGTWDTILYHVQPGTYDGANTLITVWAAHQNQTTYTKIWDIRINNQFEQGTNYYNGWNGLDLNTYNNYANLHVTYNTFWQRYAQIIFSKAFIACPGGSVVSTQFQTLFPATENPISEGSKWINGGVVGGAWNNVRTTPGKAFSAQITPDYTDALAIVSSSVFVATPNQFAQGKVFKQVGYTSIAHEAELLLRFSIVNGNAHGYEVLWSINGDLNVVRWNGGLGLYDQWSIGGVPLPINIGVAVTGDVLYTDIIGNILQVKKNGVLVATCNMSLNQDGSPTSPIWTSGQFGVGFWPNDPAATPANYCWSEFTGGNLP